VPVGLDIRARSFLRETPADDNRFADSVGRILAIATRHGQNDSGMFELNYGMNAIFLSKEPAQLFAGLMMAGGMRKRSAGTLVPTRLPGGYDEGGDEGAERILMGTTA